MIRPTGSRKRFVSGYSSSSLMVDEVKARSSASDAAKVQLPDVLGEARLIQRKYANARSISKVVG